MKTRKSESGLHDKIGRICPRLNLFFSSFCKQCNRRGSKQLQIKAGLNVFLRVQDGNLARWSIGLCC